MFFSCVFLFLNIQLILYATHSASICSYGGVHEGIAAAEAEVARIGATNRTAPIVAGVTDTVE